MDLDLICGESLQVIRGEPIQAEYFVEALKNIKSTTPFMVELGCADACYSKVFNNFFGGNCKNICLDILPRQIESAKNRCPNAEFIHGYVGEPVHICEVKENNYGAKRIYLDDLINGKKLNILHMDIQGSETYVMQELQNSKCVNDIEYIFVSLHGTYDEVKKYMPEYFECLYENPLEGGYGDGLIVAKNKNFIDE